ncbi:MAG: galactokinase [Blastocatellia bacterium]|nr:galactokinase [Blastocatellia bacterium]
MLERTAGLKQKFHDLYHSEARIFRAPGRVNLIGEHTDYNDGFVMPAAIDLYTCVAIAPRDDRKLLIHSANYSESREFSLDDPDPLPINHWSDYPRGVALALEQRGYRLRGADLLIKGDVPIGGGLSSSASVEVATCLAMVETSGLSIDRTEIARICQSAENDFVGMRCGIMDQFISCCGRAGHAMVLDCRSLDYRLLPLPEEVKLIICNTMVKHELADSQYNARRQECATGAGHLARRLSGVRSLRDVTMDDLKRYSGDLSDTVYRRCRHVVSENARVTRAAEALGGGDLNEFGRLMAASHLSLRDDYEVSCAELDLMVELASKVEGVYGARMTGGGFGGCTINLVEAGRIEEFERTIRQGYKETMGRMPDIYTCVAACGAEEILSG